MRKPRKKPIGQASLSAKIHMQVQMLTLIFSVFFS